MSTWVHDTNIRRRLKNHRPVCDSFRPRHSLLQFNSNPEQQTNVFVVNCGQLLRQQTMPLSGSGCYPLLLLAASLKRPTASTSMTSDQATSASRQERITSAQSLGRRVREHNESRSSVPRKKCAESAKILFCRCLLHLPNLGRCCMPRAFLPSQCFRTCFLVTPRPRPSYESAFATVRAVLGRNRCASNSTFFLFWFEDVAPKSRIISTHCLVGQQAFRDGRSFTIPRELLPSERTLDYSCCFLPRS